MMKVFKLLKLIRTAVRAAKRIAKFMVRGARVVETAQRVETGVREGLSTEEPSATYDPNDIKQVAAQFVRTLRKATTVLQEAYAAKTETKEAQTDEQQLSLFEVIPGGVTHDQQAHPAT